MRFPSAIPAFVALSLSLPVAACSSSSSGGKGSGSGPVIDSVDVPTTFTVTGLQYEVQGTLTFHDDGATVTQLHEAIPVYSIDSKINVTGSAQGQTSAQILLGFQATAAVASGTVVEIDVSVIDDNNVESNVEKEQITVP
jgi:hypothetical protein